MTTDDFSQVNGVSIRKRGPNEVRGVFLIPRYASEFLEVLGASTGLSKATLFKRIWLAGLQSLCGVAEADLEDTNLVRVRRSERVDDLKLMTKKVCGGDR